MKTRYLFLGLGFALAVMAFGLNAAHRAEAKDGDKKPIDFTLTDVNGKKVTLSDYRGKVVLIDIWATRCHYCVKEIPDLVKVQEAATKDKKPLQLIGITLDTNKDTVKAFLKKQPVNYPIVFAEDKAMKPFGQIYGIPVKFIIDKEGVIAEKFVGAMSKKDLEKKLEKYLK